MSVPEKKMVLTYEGLKRMEEELQNLKIFRRKDVAEKIKEARGQGDLSENAEYDSAKEEQAEIEARIVVLEKILRNAEVIDDDDVKRDVVSVGATVKIFDVEFEEEIQYIIVGSAEADPMNGRISNESPVGIALLGKKEGVTVDVETPSGMVQFKVMEIVR